jgi:DNA-binding NarL/FixJ family response regulator
MTIRIVIADDHPVVRDGLSALLASRAGIEVVATAAGGREAVRAAVVEKPDVLIMDLQMPDLDGVTACREIGRAAPDVAVLVLTMFDDDDSVFAAMAQAPGVTCSRARRRTRSGGPSTPSPPVRRSSGRPWPAGSSSSWVRQEPPQPPSPD